LAGFAYLGIDDPLCGTVDSEGQHECFVVAVAYQRHCTDDRHYHRHARYFAGSIDNRRFDATASRRANDTQRRGTSNSVTDIVDSDSNAGGFDHDGDNNGDPTAESKGGQYRAQCMPPNSPEIDDPENAESRG
jgi:hypothetical protein